jgi:hypothetical protein
VGHLFTVVLKLAQKRTGAWEWMIVAVARTYLSDEGLPEDGHRVLIVGPIGSLDYPAICPNCGEAADRPLTITKVFQYNEESRNGGNSSGWQYRTTSAQPLFCQECAAQRRREEPPVTTADLWRSLLSEAMWPALGLGALGLFLLQATLGKVLRHPAGNWPLTAIAGLFLVGGFLSARAAWRNGAYRRVPAATYVSRAFDFGDNDDDSSFCTTARTFVIRNSRSAEAFAALNVERSADRVMPDVRRRERRLRLILIPVGVVIFLIWLVT